jgi:hypothetical protein
VAPRGRLTSHPGKEAHAAFHPMARPSLIRPTMKAPPIYTIPATGVRRGARTEGRPSRMRAHGHLPLRHARALRRVRGSATRRCGRRRQPPVPTTVRVTSRVVRRGRSIVEGWRPAAHRHLPFALRPRVAAKNFDALWQLATALTIGTHARSATRRREAALGANWMTVSRLPSAACVAGPRCAAHRRTRRNARAHGDGR